MTEGREKKAHKKNSAVILTSRIRLARNLAGRPFTNAAKAAQLYGIGEKCALAISKIGKFKGGEFLKMSEIPDRREFLAEERLISKDLASGDVGGVYISKDATASVMINEEDHLRIQIIRPGQCLNSLWHSISALDDEIEENLEYAFSSKLGYLTACPTNVGTGMRASLMMHLPALVYGDMMDKIIRGLNQLGMVVRGSNGESTESTGAAFQLSNQQTLGLSESDIIGKIVKYGKKIEDFEINARIKLAQDAPMFLADKFLRAASLLESCKVIDTAEAITALSSLRLAADMGYFPDPSTAIGEISALIDDIRPRHLLAIFRLDDASAEDRDILRAQYLNSKAALYRELDVKPLVKKCKSKNNAKMK